MKILFLAPQPFFQERGTPIAVRLAVQVLTGRRGDTVDLLTYHEGQEVSVPRLRQFRIPLHGILSGVGPGISLKKLICDVVFAACAFLMVLRARRERYDLVHAVEESVFVAWCIRLLWGIPYVYDMDSSLALQLTEKWRWTRPLRPFLSFLERRAVRGSVAVVPVCDALAAIANDHGSPRTMVLSDISFLTHDASGAPVRSSEGVDLRAEMGVASDRFVFLYIGNLERYQGIDLMIDSFVAIKDEFPRAALAIIGGGTAHIDAYRAEIARKGAAESIYLLGPRPMQELNSYLRQANVLVSPRSLGNNTPMKIYSYLHSGVPVLATRLPTHTQVLSDETAVLAEANTTSFADAMRSMVRDPSAALRRGERARAVAEERYTFERFSETLHQIYDQVARHQSPGSQH